MATIPALRTWTAGEIVTAAMLNSNVRDAINFILAPPAAALRQTAVQSIPNNAFTSITWDTEDVDNDGAHSTVTNPSRYTAQTPGWHRVNGGDVGFVTVASAGTRRGSHLAVNGSALAGSQLIWAAGTTNGVNVPIVGRDVFLNVGDFLEVQGFQDTGAALNTQILADGQSGVTIQWVRS